MPVSWSKKKQIGLEGKPHQQTPDLDNLIKGFTDALTDADSQIWNISACKLWGREGAILVENYETETSR
jgi:Holliday junction resolvase RusA-like endonuclease